MNFDLPETLDILARTPGVATWAVHDLNHIAQITRGMAKRYTEAVGA